MSSLALLKYFIITIINIAQSRNRRGTMLILEFWVWREKYVHYCLEFYLCLIKVNHRRKESKAIKCQQLFSPKRTVKRKHTVLANRRSSHQASQHRFLKMLKEKLYGIWSHKSDVTLFKLSDYFQSINLFNERVKSLAWKRSQFLLQRVHMLTQTCD